MPANWLLTGNGRSRPAAAQPRNPTTTASPATVATSAGSRPRSRPLRKPAAAARHSTAQITTVIRPGRATVPSWTSSKASDRANWAEPRVEGSRTSRITPMTPMSTPVEMR